MNFQGEQPMQEEDTVVLTPEEKEKILKDIPDNSQLDEDEEEKEED